MGRTTAALAILALALLIPFESRAAAAAERSVRAATEAQRGGLASYGAPALLALLVGGAGAALTRARRAPGRPKVAEPAAATDDQAAVLRANERRARALLAGSADVIALVDVHTQVLDNAEAVERCLNLCPGELAGQPLTAFLESDDAKRTRAKLAELAHRPGAGETLSWPLHCAGGVVKHVEALVTNRLDDPHLCGFVLDLRDVSERRVVELELRHNALHDDLTGLANRTLLEDRLRHVIARSARSVALHAVILLDLDDFRGIIDAHGAKVGDELLVNVARRLQARLRPNDTLARMQGDVFAVLLEDVPVVDDAAHTARRLIEALREPFRIDGHDLVVGASAGVEVGDGSLPGAQEEIAARELLHADAAMRAARRSGSGCVERYETEMHEAVAQRVELRAQIRNGLRRGEFCVHYQPIVELGGERVVGFEALARWEHPVRGLVSPGEFIPVAEQTGLIVDLGNHVLREACAQLAEWNAVAASSFYVAVNVAGAQLHNDAFVDKVAAILRGTGVPPDRLLLEVTETALVRDTAGSIRRLEALRALGVRLAVDDFGTGYSSLNYLRRFPMDVLKVDKSFVDEVGERREDCALVDAIVTLGRALGLTVVAEGIEQRVQADQLRALGCQLGQGYLFSRPVPAREAAALVAAPAAIPAVA